MPTYNYSCSLCNKLWEETQSIADRESPCALPCPHCKKKKVFKTMEGCLPGLGADANLTPNRASGGRWNELMSKIKSGVPKRLHKNVDGSGGAGQRWR